MGMQAVCLFSQSARTAQKSGFLQTDVSDLMLEQANPTSEIGGSYDIPRMAGMISRGWEAGVKALDREAAREARP